MRKIMLLAAMLAMVLAAAMPALAQDTDVVGDENVVTNEGDDTQYNAVCQNIIGSIGDINQTQYGNSNAVAVDDSNAVAEVAQEQDVTIAQVNRCLNDFDVDDDGVVEVIDVVSVTKGEKVVKVVDGEEVVTVVKGGEVVATVSASASSSASASASASSSPSVAAVTELPETGGATLLALGAGVMLVGGGLVARRMMR
jgi:LPXTG-motif cell wall-anchored protein